MKNFFATFFLMGTSLFASDAIQLNIQLPPDFDKQFHCNWKAKTPLTFWLEGIKDERAQKEIGWLLTKKDETPIFAQKEISLVLKEAIQKSLKSCGFSESYKDDARVLLTGRLEKFHGLSKKGLTKGEAKGVVVFTLGLQDVEKNDSFSILFEFEETQTKGISKNLKKLENILNNLLTRLTLEIFQSRQVAEWIAMR